MFDNPGAIRIFGAVAAPDTRPATAQVYGFRCIRKVIIVVGIIVAVAPDAGLGLLVFHVNAVEDSGSVVVIIRIGFGA